MSESATRISLPATLRTKLTALAVQVRWLRLARGGSLVLLVLAALTTVVFLTDFFWPLAMETLGWLLAGVAIVTLLTLLPGCAWPVCRRIDLEGLAALIEQRWPELGERLTSSVELAGKPESGHGSRALIELLVQETAQQTAGLNFAQALSLRATRLALVLAGVALALIAVPLTICPAAYTDFTARFLTAWFAPPALTIDVDSGDCVAGLGRPWSVSATIRRRDERIPLPRSAQLVLTDGAGKVTRLPMQPQAQAIFTGTFDRVPGSLRYHVEAGKVRSDTYQLSAIQPVELMAASPAVTVTPPAYVNRAVHPEQTIAASSSVSVLQYSQVRLNFRFNRPAVAGQVILSPRLHANGANTFLPLDLRTDRPEASLLLPALAPGVYRLRLHVEAEHRIASDYELPEIGIWPDEPPVLVERPRVFGVKESDLRKDWAVQVDPVGVKFDPTEAGLHAGQAQKVTPTDTLKLKIGVEDRVGLDRVELEYSINGGPRQVETVAQAGGQPTVCTEYQFALKGKVRDGDVVLYRLKICDNRRVAKGILRDITGHAVPTEELTSHILWYPEPQGGKARWFLLQVDRQADSLARQEILAQKEEIQQRLAAIQKKLKQERDDLKKLQQATKDRPDLNEEQVTALDRMREQNRAITKDLARLALDTVQTPVLQHLAAGIHAVADKEMPQADRALKQAQDKTNDPLQRQQQMERADQELARAQQKLENLLRENEQVARDRLDQLQLQELAQRERDLADQAAQLEDKDNLRDPRALDELNKLRAEQQKIAEELRKLTEKSDLLRDALKAAQVDNAMKLARQAANLAQQQRDLTNRADQMQMHLHQQRLADLARRQQELAAQAAQLGQKTEKTARDAGTIPLNAEPPKQAAEELKKGDVPAALHQQQQALSELQRLAQDLEQMPDLDRIRKMAGGQNPDAVKLAQAQKDLITKLKEEAARLQAFLNQPEVIRKAMDAIQKTQEAIARGIEQLPVTPATKHARQQAGELTAGAVRDLAKKKADALNAFYKMEKAVEFLDFLARQLPAAPDPSQLAQQQRDLAQHTQKAGGDGQKLQNLAKQQQNLGHQAALLPKDDGPVLNKAQQAMKLAEEALAKTNADEAFRRQQEAADALDELGRLARARDKAAQQALAKQAQEGTKQLRELAQAQKDLREELQRLAQVPLPPSHPIRGLLAQQENLKQETGELMKGLQELAQGKDTPAPAQQPAQLAAQEAQQAQQAQQQAQMEMKQGNAAQAKAAGEQAAQMLEQAAQQAQEAAQQLALLGKGGQNPDAEKTGQALQTGKDQMQQAQKNLATGQAQPAGQAMQQAAQALQQAADQAGLQLARQNQGQIPGQPGSENKIPGKVGVVGTGLPDLKMYGLENGQFAGKTWGQLPGELRTRILQDIRARYGEDYAVIIQRYFEQIADTSAKKE